MAKKSGIKIAVFAVVLLVVFLPPFIKYQQINYKSMVLDRQLKSIKEEIKVLEEEKRRLETDIIYVEKRARDRIGVAKKGEIILVAEDEEADVLFLRRAWRKAGIAHPLVHACDGEEAIRYLSGKPPFADRAQHPLPVLILLDLKMPQADGFAVLAWRQARPLLQQIPVVVLTSSAAPADQVKARQLGAADYLVKPQNPDDLLAVVQRLQARWLAPGKFAEAA